jgi:hypothetical protein
VSAKRKAVLKKRAEKTKRRGERDVGAFLSDPRLTQSPAAPVCTVVRKERDKCSACGEPFPICDDCGVYFVTQPHQCDYVDCKYRGTHFECPDDWCGTEGWCENVNCPSHGDGYECPAWPADWDK